MDDVCDVCGQKCNHGGGGIPWWLIIILGIAIGLALSGDDSGCRCSITSKPAPVEAPAENS